MTKTPEEMAEELANQWANPDTNHWKDIKGAFLDGFKRGRDMSHKEMFDFYLELRKKHGQEEPEHKPIVEKFRLTLIERKGFFS